MSKLESTFSELLKSKRRTGTPGMPGRVLDKPKGDEELLDEKEHKEYRSGVGCLLYLLKHSRPELCNPIEN